jgi:quercetin dioxygenase-like cupin family protein
VPTAPATPPATSTPAPSAAAIARTRDDAAATWFLNSLVTTTVTRAETAGAYAISEHLLTAAANPPRHVQTAEEEAFYVLDGEVELEVDGRVVLAGPGTFALVPRGVPHVFAVRSATARMLVISSSGGGQPVPGGGLDDFFVAAGEPAGARVLPEPAAPDGAALAAIAAAHGIELLVG